MDLSDKVSTLKGVGAKRATELAKLGIATLYDLLTYYPRAYEDMSQITRIGDLRPDEWATVAARIVAVRQRQAYRRELAITSAIISDGSGFAQVIWFNQPYISKKLYAGRRIFLRGKAGYDYAAEGQLTFSQLSSFELLPDGEGIAKYALIKPIYHTTASLKQPFWRKLLRALLEAPLGIVETIPESVRKRYSLVGRREALASIHFPADSRRLQKARERLIFEELYLIQCGLLILKERMQQERRGVRHLGNSQLVQGVLASLPFALTGDQERVWQEICADMERPLPMRRLVQGDVGSGKTAIALLALVKTVENGYQGALMAPTEILAKQHYESFARSLKGFPVRVGFLSGSLSPKKRTEIYGQIAQHGLDIIIGTHALIQDEIHFARLGLVVTDEQHRFGVMQRAELEKKGSTVPDALVMTATPIPRTMMLTVYGDLDLSLIKELPPGRKAVRTFVRTSERRGLIYKFVRQQLEAGRQAYVVCPLIEKTEGLDLPSAEEVFAELSAGIFQGLPCALVHGRLRPADKEKTMRDFYDGTVKLLVATSVIEVGVNVPNASIMVIEHADRFGLSQLHQLRGRIGRGEHESYCILVSDSRTENAKERLAVMEATGDGFKLAEEDLRLRGPGQFFGAMQHGLPDLKIANVLTDMDILLKARQAALRTVNTREDTAHILPVLAREYKEQFMNITEV